MCFLTYCAPPPGGPHVTASTLLGRVPLCALPLFPLPPVLLSILCPILLRTQVLLCAPSLTCKALSPQELPMLYLVLGSRSAPRVLYCVPPLYRLSYCVFPDVFLPEGGLCPS